VKNFYQNLQKSSIQKILLVELNIFPLDSPLGLNGCGMAIINAPWKLDEQLQQLFPWLLDTLSPEKQGSYSINDVK
jgi:23S rRNA (adenine2030-N6)-methyltransferase